jgi:hypothetical protein
MSQQTYVTVFALTFASNDNIPVRALEFYAGIGQVYK